MIKDVTLNDLIMTIMLRDKRSNKIMLALDVQTFVSSKSQLVVRLELNSIEIEFFC
jgi:hypothetical protein